jgi:hypothetical protein
MPETTAAGLLAVIGIFDVVGTIASGWLTDRIDPRVLLGGYYASGESPCCCSRPCFPRPCDPASWCSW